MEIDFMRRMSTLLVLLVTCLAWPEQATHKLVTFDVPHAGKGAGQGTVGGGIVTNGSIVGNYSDTNNVSHGYLRAPDGSFTKFDFPNSHGTFPVGMNSALAISGYFSDANGVFHGFQRSASGQFVQFDAPDAGKASGQGTVAENINTAGEVAGYYCDSNGAFHGFLRTPGGQITEFDAPGAGQGPGLGTMPTTFSGLT